MNFVAVCFAVNLCSSSSTPFHKMEGGTYRLQLYSLTKSNEGIPLKIMILRFVQQLVRKNTKIAALNTLRFAFTAIAGAGPWTAAAVDAIAFRRG